VAAAARSAAAADPPRLTLLKVAHHGSAGSTSAEFLRDTAPALAVVSAGVDDPFGHPSSAALDRLAAAKVDVWRTDRDGAVTWRTDGRTIAASSFSAPSGRGQPPPAAPP
jgi:competence protein ComEC